MVNRGRGKKRLAKDTRNLPVAALNWIESSSAPYPAKSMRQQEAIVNRTITSQPSPSGSANGAGPSAPRRKVPKVHKKNTRGETALHIWAKKDKNKCLELIMEGADVNSPDYAGWTPLHEACSHHHFDTAQLLIEHGAQVNVASSDGDTPLHDAASSNNPKITWLLLKHGANRDARDKSNLRPIDVAKGKTVKQLLTDDNLPEECPLSEPEDGNNEDTNKPQNAMSSSSSAPSDALPQVAQPQSQPPLTVSIDSNQDAFATPALDSAPSQARSSSILSVATSQETPMEASDVGLDMSDESESEESRESNDVNTANTSPQLSPSSHRMDSLSVNARSPSPNRRGKSSEPELGKRTAVWRQDRSESQSRAVSPNHAYDFDAEDSREEVRSESGFGGKRRGARGRGRGARASSSGSTTPLIKKAGRGGRGGRRGRGYARVVEMASEAPSYSGEDPYDFRGTPDSEMDERMDDRESSVGPSSKRMRLMDNTDADSNAGIGDGEDDGDEDEPSSRGPGTSNKKVPPLRISLKHPSDEDGDVTYPRTKHLGRGRPGGKKGADGDDDKRVTRSKVRQSGRGLVDDGEGWSKKKRARGAATNDPPMEADEQIDEAALVRPPQEPEMIPNLGDVGEGQKLLLIKPYEGGRKLHKMFHERWMNDLKEDKVKAEKAAENLAAVQVDWEARMAPLTKVFPLLPPEMPSSLLNDPEAAKIWTRQQQERTKQERKFHIDRYRKQLAYNDDFKRMKQRCDGTAPTMSVVRVQAERDACNPMAVDEKFRKRVPRPRQEFDDKLAKTLKNVQKDEKDHAETLRSMQMIDWKMLWAKRGVTATDELKLQMVPFARHDMFVMEFPPTSHNMEQAIAN